MKANADQIARALDDQRAAFKAFLTARVGSAAEADDTLQNGLVKALRRASASSRSPAWPCSTASS